jgi:UDP-glucose 4-epimerase
MYTLVTGGAGFIGTHLIKALLTEKPHTKIVSLDDYSTGLKSNHIQGVQYIEGRTQDALRLLERFEIDKIYHFGEYSRIHQSYNEIEKVQSSCVEGTSQIIRLAINQNAILIYSASSSHFGQKDQDLSPYSWYKKQNVDLIKKHQKWSNLKSHIFYFFNAYGPGQITEGAYATVLGIWENQIKNQQAITIVEPGTQIRIFTRVESIALACTRHELLPINGEWALHSEDKVTLLQIVKKLKKKTKWLEARDGDRLKVPKLTIPKPPYWEHPYRLEDWIGDLRRWTRPETIEDYDI